MPSVIIQGPIIEKIEIKRTLVAEITDALEKAYGINRSAYTIVIQEYTSENVGSGGVLIIDKIKK